MKEKELQVVKSTEAGTNGSGTPDPEVQAKQRRRRFSTKYKLKILKEIDDIMAAGGTFGALLRREGLYYTQIQDWRKARDVGELNPEVEKKRGRKPDPDLAHRKALAKMERELARTREKLRVAKGIIEIQKKVAELMGEPLPPVELPANWNTDEDE